LKEFQADQIRNIGLVGHGASGKTSLAEAILYTTKVASRLGKIEDGSTVSDYSEEETKRQISISATLLHCEHQGNKINLVDMPGFVDFVGEVVGGLRVVDTAMLVIDAFTGPEGGSEIAFETADNYSTPMAIVVNKIDKEHVDFDACLGKIHDILSPRALPVQLPIGQALELKGVVDLLEMKAYEFGEDGAAKEMAVPGDLEGRCKEAREKLVEAAAEADDKLLEKFFEAGELTPEELEIGLRKAIQDRVLFPVFITSATSNRGVKLLLDSICRYLPAPSKFPEINVLKDEKVEAWKTGDGQPLVAFVFKTVAEKHVGELTLFRMYSGTLKPGTEVYNSSRGHSEKIGQIYALNGKERTEMQTVHAGDIGAFVKLKDTHTGDTICDNSSKVEIPPIEFPPPSIEFGVLVESKGDEDKMGTGFTSLAHEDPTFSYEVNPELKQTIVHGQGELHLDVIMKKLKNNLGIEVQLIEPRIPYRETITRKGETQYRYKKQSGGRGQYGDVSIRLEPLKRGESFEFVDAITGGVIPSKFIPSVEKGIVEAMEQGVISGNKVVDVKVTLFFGSYHTVDSSDMAFKIAGSMAFKKAARECGPILLEPVYNLEIVVPDDHTGDVMGDMSSRRGKILGMEPLGNGKQRVKAQAPLSELFKYSTSLRSMTGGRGRHIQQFSHYDPVPKEITDKLVAAYEAERAEGN